MSVSPIRDFGYEAQQAAVAHLDACWEAWHAESEGEDADWPETAGPFCGCQTCEIREVLHAAWPLMLEAARSEVRTL